MTARHKKEQTFIKIGSIHLGKDNEEPLIELGPSRQGSIFKDEEAFLYHPDQICYVPEECDVTYTQEDFLNLANGQMEFAKELFYGVDWQHPETYADEMFREEEWGWCPKCKKIYAMEGERKPCPICRSESTK